MPAARERTLNTGPAMNLADAFVAMPAIRSLVRQALRCGCPEEVFDDVRIGVPTLFATHDVHGGLELLVGRRLLITLVPLAGLADPAAEIPALLESGGRIRDQHRLNRFRLVVIGVPDRALRERLDRIATVLEDRLHLHLLEQVNLDPHSSR
jgi:hypothetical protein